MAENKGQIKVLRANSITEDVGKVILEEGQPFYDKETKHLYIGEGNNVANSKSIIADTNNIVFYCESDSDEEIKEINIPGYKLIDNQEAFLIFKNGNNIENFSLKINNTSYTNIICYSDYKEQSELYAIRPNSLYRLKYSNNQIKIIPINVRNSDNALNVTSAINGKQITDIFENDGTTVKNSSRIQGIQPEFHANNIIQLHDSYTDEWYLSSSIHFFNASNSDTPSTQVTIDDSNYSYKTYLIEFYANSDTDNAIHSSIITLPSILSSNYYYVYIPKGLPSNTTYGANSGVTFYYYQIRVYRSNNKIYFNVDKIAKQLYINNGNIDVRDINLSDSSLKIRKILKLVY